MDYILTKEVNNLKEIYKIICTQIKSSIFIYLGFNFFKRMVLDNIIHIYTIKKYKKISAVVTVIEFKNYKLINKKIFYYLINNPLIFIKSFGFLLISLKKKSNLHINKNYLHLLHLIIFKKKFLNITIKKKDLILNEFYKKILKTYKAKYFFLCFEKNNIKAYKYYKRNNFIIFKKNKDIVYLKKFFNY